jgi:hypothetical protein
LGATRAVSLFWLILLINGSVNGADDGRQNGNTRSIGQGEAAISEYISRKEGALLRMGLKEIHIVALQYVSDPGLEVCPYMVR